MCDDLREVDPAWLEQAIISALSDVDDLPETNAEDLIDPEVEDEDEFTHLDDTSEVDQEIPDAQDALDDPKFPSYPTPPPSPPAALLAPPSWAEAYWILKKDQICSDRLEYRDMVNDFRQAMHAKIPRGKVTKGAFASFADAGEDTPPGAVGDTQSAEAEEPERRTTPAGKGPPGATRGLDWLVGCSEREEGGTHRRGRTNPSLR